jgi:hypothetical protein
MRKDQLGPPVCLWCDQPFAVLIPRVGLLHPKCTRAWLGLSRGRNSAHGLCDGCGKPGAEFDPALGVFLHESCGRACDIRLERIRETPFSTTAWYLCRHCGALEETKPGERIQPCACGTWRSRPWRTRLDGPWPRGRGHVWVLRTTEEGQEQWQELRGPHWQEHPDAWRNGSPPA